MYSLKHMVQNAQRRLCTSDRVVPTILHLQVSDPAAACLVGSLRRPHDRRANVHDFDGVTAALQLSRSIENRSRVRMGYCAVVLRVHEEYIRRHHLHNYVSETGSVRCKPCTSMRSIVLK